MSYSPGTIDALIDLVELKLSDLDDENHEDWPDLCVFRRALIELEADRGGPTVRGSAIVLH